MDKDPKQGIITPYIDIPDRNDFPKGKAFNFIRPQMAQNHTSLEVWERVKQSEAQRATFYGDTLDVASHAIARHWARLFNLAKNEDLKIKLKYVNSFFNQWPAKDDRELWGVEDYWTTPREFITYGGDCEDYAIAKYFALKALGVPAENMCLIIADDFKAMITHAFLVVINPKSQDFYVLDNTTNVIYKNGAAEKYVPVYFLNEYSVWRPAP